MNLGLARLASPLGTLLVVSDADAKLRALDFDDYEERMQRFLRLHYGSYELSAGAVPATIALALHVYFDGDFAALDAVPVATGGTPFQRRVWTALRNVPAGTTTTYGALAATLGKPGASRAVGHANGANPLAIVVPCHRVLGADGTLTGYGGGLARKRWLLEHEGALPRRLAR